eukprot:765096-Hanusia_phi.AAC.4
MTKDVTLLVPPKSTLHQGSEPAAKLVLTLPSTLLSPVAPAATDDWLVSHAELWSAPQERARFICPPSQALQAEVPRGLALLPPSLIDEFPHKP